MDNFIKEWLDNCKWWFSKTEKIDNYIINKYEYLLDLEPNITQYNFLSYIVLYDQIPRHIFRNQDGSHIILYFLNKAIDIVNTFKNQANNLNEIELTFFMLQLRHTNTNLRSLLNVSKNNIYQFVQKHNITYVKNSTPEWSQRGKIRNNIVPVLKLNLYPDYLIYLKIFKICI